MHALGNKNENMPADSDRLLCLQIDAEKAKKKQEQEECRKWQDDVSARRADASEVMIQYIHTV